MAQQRNDGKLGECLEKAIRGRAGRAGFAVQHSIAANELGLGVKTIGRTAYVCNVTWPPGSREVLDTSQFGGDFEAVIYVSPYHDLFWEAANNIFLKTQKNLAKGYLYHLSYNTRKDLGLYGKNT